MSAPNPISGRQEIKYLVDLPTLNAFDKGVRQLLSLDPNNADDSGYFNYSIYFDSPDYMYYLEKSEGLSVRIKPRLRVYKEMIDGPPVARFFEFKLRDEKYVAKERAVVSPRLSHDLLQPQHILDDPEVQASPILRRFAYLTKRYGLQPMMVVLYHRSAYRCPVHDSLRITYDRRIQCSEIIGLDVPPEQFSYVEPPNQALIEIKYNGTCPRWLLRIIGSLQMQQLSFSKYVESVERCYSRKMRRPV